MIRHMNSVDVCLTLFGVAASSMLCITGVFGTINAFHNQVTLDWIETDSFSHWTGEVNPLFASVQHSIVLL